ncbi:MAG: nuclear transport factor 2 family protein [Actinomycetota bacterium]|nr:nuclear transport factor 2 family protein [Actinomycetota bacterium]
MHPNAEVIDRFYSALAAGDHETMARSYSDNARFKDPVFSDLSAEQVRAMWRMFCTSGSDLAVSHTDVRADDAEGAARWEAIYAFPKTGRRVYNKITAHFAFSDGKIARHVDSFDLYRWTRMALGPMGVLLGWTPIVQNQVRSRAMAQLERFRREEAGSS